MYSDTKSGCSVQHNEPTMESSANLRLWHCDADAIPMLCWEQRQATCAHVALATVHNLMSQRSCTSQQSPSYCLHTIYTLVYCQTLPLCLPHMSENPTSVIMLSILQQMTHRNTAHTIIMYNVTRQTESIKRKCNVLLSFVSIDGQKRWVNMSWYEWALLWPLGCTDAVRHWIQHFRYYVWQRMKRIMKYSRCNHHIKDIINILLLILA